MEYEVRSCAYHWKKEVGSKPLDHYVEVRKGVIFWKEDQDVINQEDIDNGKRKTADVITSN